MNDQREIMVERLREMIVLARMCQTMATRKRSMPPALMAATIGSFNEDIEALEFAIRAIGMEP